MKQIALAFPLGVSHLERVAYGIRRFSRESSNWQLITNPEKHHLEIEQLVNWDGDGIIGFIHDDDEAEIIRQKKIPFINLSGALEKSPFPRVRVDYYQMGQLGAEHFLAKGFESFAYYGIENVWYAQEIGRGFRDALGKNTKYSEYLAQSTLSGNYSGGDKGLSNWLESLPTPTALMSAHDPRALEVLQTCRRLDIRVPNEIALLGNNNDGITCELATPSLSSIPRDGDAIGYLASQLLEKLLRGESIADEDTVVPALAVVERESTAFLAIKDKDLLFAVEYIKENIDKHINVETTCTYLNRSRRWLEYTFKKQLKMSPLKFIAQVKVDKAKELLLSSKNHNLSDVANMSGFSGTEQMNKAFRKVIGQNAREFKDMK